MGDAGRDLQRSEKKKKKKNFNGEKKTFAIYINNQEKVVNGRGRKSH